jgi:cytochrome c biogenesis protein CcmG/thiol:disulfide interchange protein DsbE
MSDDVMNRLRRENPVPDTMPALPIEPVLLRLDDEPSSAHHRSRAATKGGRRVIGSLTVALAVIVSVAVAAVVITTVHRRSTTPTESGAGGSTSPEAVHQTPGISHMPQTNQALASLDAQLARGIEPVAPVASLKMPILGRKGTEDLADLRGKVVVVNLFASWCEPCAAEESVLEQTEKEIVGQNATILGITYLGLARASEAFVTAHRITYPVLRDVSGKFAHAYGATGVPETYVINREGRVAAIRRYAINRGWLEHILTALAITPPAPTARQHISLTEVEANLMCMACHQPLELAHAPQAVFERAYISSLIARGATKAQIDRTLVRQYGPAVLATR